MSDHDYYIYKIIADMLGYITAIFVNYAFFKYIDRSYKTTRHPQMDFWYYYYLIAGSMAGGILVSTLDDYLINPNGPLMISKSIVGAIAGGILTAELIKYHRKITGSTGYKILPGILCGLIIGRIGAFLIGLRDHTHGIPTTLPRGYDYGDGILRHPTQLYEVLFLVLLGLYLSYNYYKILRTYVKLVFIFSWEDTAYLDFGLIL